MTNEKFKNPYLYVLKPYCDAKTNEKKTKIR